MSEALDQIKLAIFVAGIVMILGLMGCGSEPGPYPNLWTQKVAVSGWGFTMATAYGPFNIGYLSWQRNLDQPMAPAKPGDLIGVVSRATIP